jgi:hypothetical protein
LRVANRTRTFGRLGDLATVNVNFDGMVADGTSEESIFHVWDNRSGSNDEAFDRNNLVHIYKISTIRPREMGNLPEGLRSRILIVESRPNGRTLYDLFWTS